MKLSFIIPIYNTGQFVEKCVNSILGTGLNDIEILCINDGSTDNSKEILENIERKSSIVKVINKLNGGLSDTRNIGISHSSGDYIIFIDSDDWIYSEKFLSLYKYCNDNYDIIHGNFDFIYENNIIKKNKPQIEMVSSGQEILNYALLQDKFSCPACINIYKRSFLLENNLLFTKGIFHEDEEFNLRAFSYAKNVISTNINFYCYYQRIASITNDNKNLIKRLDDIIYIYDAINLFLIESSHVTKKYKENIKTYLSFILILGYAKIKDPIIGKDYRERIIKKEIEKNIQTNLVLYKIAKFGLKFFPRIFLDIFKSYFNLRNKKLK